MKIGVVKALLRLNAILPYVPQSFRLIWIKFATEDILKNAFSDCECSENWPWLMPYFTQRCKWISASTLYVYRPIWLKSGITDLHTVLLSIVLNEDWRREGMKLHLCMYHQAV